MKFSAIVEQVLTMLQRQGRILYRALKREFDLDDAYIEELQNTPHPSPLPQGTRGLQVRIGIHTGLVVIGEIGSSEKRECWLWARRPISPRASKGRPPLMKCSLARLSMIHRRI